MQTWNRRDMMRMLIAPLLGSAGHASGSGGAVHTVTYRADAVVTFLGMPMFSRAGVGSGYAEAAPVQGANTYRLRFAGSSRPEQARGLDRSGYIEESIQEENGSLLASRYFGLMTDSQEETMEQAQHSLRMNANELSFAAIEGASLPGSCVSSVATFGYPRRTGEKDWHDLLAAARRSLAAGPPPRSVRSVSDTGCAAPTFLLCVKRAMTDARNQMRQRFVYGDRERILETERSLDPHARRTMHTTGPVYQLTGKVRKRERDSPTVFRIWFEQGSILPLRIDYQPRPYLRLSFVRVASDPNLHARFTAS